MNYYFYPAEDVANSQNYTVPLAVVRAACDGFKPPDSVLLSVKTNKPDPDLAPGIQYVYKSAWLSRQLDAYWFYFDEGIGTMAAKRNTPVDPGIYTLFYLGTAQTGYEMCFLTTGINWPF